MTSELRWKRAGQWVELSDDGNYTVACARVNGVYRFEAWHLTGGKAEPLGVFDNAEDARNTCRGHKGRVAA